MILGKNLCAPGLSLLLLVKNVQSEECSPLESVKHIMACVKAKDAECASAGYNPAFAKLHNGLPSSSMLGVHTKDWWAAIFAVGDLSLDYNYTSENREKKEASIRYVETVSTTDGTTLGLPASDAYPFAQTFEQHEHAIVTVDDDCKLILWDQYGDNAEQEAVDTATAAILQAFQAATASE